MTAIKSPTFYKEGMWTPAEVVWRPGVEFSMLADWPSQKYRTQTAKLRCDTRRRLVTHLFCSWMGKRTQYFLTPTLFRDDEKIIKCYKSEGFSRSDYHVNEMSNSEYSVPLLTNYPVEEPWLIESSTCIETSAVKMASDSFEVVTESTSNKSEHPDPLSTNYPVEEPWIFEPSTCIDSSAVKVVSDSSEQVTESTSNDTEIPLPEEEGNIMTREDSVSTVILINSSICTVQRIAVLENDKLVELLLEPVKTNVQCDSVYLGVVSKLVPHMGGAFVNIGSPRPSFMDIRPNREPFILHSFHGPMKEREVNGSTSTKPRDGLDFPKIGALLGGVEEPDEIEDDQSEDEFDNDDFESHENRFHLDFLEVIKEKVNGTVVKHEREDELDQLNEDADQQQSNSVDQDIGTEDSKWAQVKKGSKIIVQVVKEGLGTKGPTLTAYPKLRSRFWVLSTRCNTTGISKKISGLEKTRLRAIAKSLQPQGFGLTVRTVASGHSVEELQKDLEGLLSTWKSIVDHAKSAALAADEGVEGSVPVLLHRAMGKTLSVVQDYFNEKVKCMVVDSPRTYHEVTNYLQDIAPNLCDRVQLYSKRTPLFDEYGIEEEINNVLSKRVPLANGGYLVIEQTEALVSIDVNGGQCMLGQGTSQEKAILEVNLAAAKQIARELRLRDIGGIIVVDFIDMMDDSNNRLVYEEVKKAVERDRSTVRVSELSANALMEITRKRVRPSVTFMISEPCTCCHATGRVEALETVFSKIEREICRFLSKMEQKADPENPKSWPRFILRVDQHMCNYLTTGKRTKLAVLSSSLKVWILLKVARGLTRGKFELKCLTDENIDDNVHHLSLLLPKKNFRQESNPLSLQKAKQLGI